MILRTELLNVKGNNILSIRFSERVKSIIIDHSDNFQFFDIEDLIAHYEEYEFTFRELHRGKKIKGEKVTALIFLENEYFLEDFIIS